MKKTRSAFLSLIVLIFSLLGSANAAFAGECNDYWVTYALNYNFGKSYPTGSGNSGDCNINLYGGGHWSSWDELYYMVRYSKTCQDPWVGEAIYLTQNRVPNGSGISGECNINLYGNGQWSSFDDLKSKVIAANNSLRVNQIRIDSSGNLIKTTTNQIVATPNQYVIGRQTANGVIAAGGGNVIAAGGGNVIAAGGGNVIAAGGGNVIAAGGGNVIAVGGGNAIVIGGANLRQ